MNGFLADLFTKWKVGAKRSLWLAWRGPADGQGLRSFLQTSPGGSEAKPAGLSGWGRGGGPGGAPATSVLLNGESDGQKEENCSPLLRSEGRILCWFFL